MWLPILIRCPIVTGDTIVGRHEACPSGGGVGDDGDAVDVIGHDYKCIQFHVEEPFWRDFPFGNHHTLGIIKPHLNRISPSTTSLNSQALSCVMMVTKYAPG